MKYGSAKERQAVEKLDVRIREEDRRIREQKLMEGMEDDR